MTATASHPTHDELVRCATDIDPSDPLLTRVRRHLETDGCDECSAAVFDVLASRGAAARRTPLASRWVRPVRLGGRKGMRVGAVADYQLVCSAGPFALDVLVRDCEQERELRFVGQVTRAGHIMEPVPDLPLRLIGVPRTPAGDTATDEFGEFSLASSREGMYGLRLGPGPESPCVMVWEGWDQ